MSLKLEILNYLKLRSQEFIHGGEIERFCFSKGRMGSNGLRRCRELSNSGLIEREIRKNEVWYRFKGEESPIIKEMREIRERAEREKEIVRKRKELKNFNPTSSLF